MRHGRRTLTYYITGCATSWSLRGMGPNVVTAVLKGRSRNFLNRVSV